VGGPGFTSGPAGWCSMVIYNNTPFLAYEDNNNSGKATVEEYTGGAWTTVGAPDFSLPAGANLQLAASNNILYLALIDWDSRLDVWGYE
jgi:hypothetical protein